MGYQDFWKHKRSKNPEGIFDVEEPEKKRVKVTKVSKRSRSPSPRRKRSKGRSPRSRVSKTREVLKKGRTNYNLNKTKVLKVESASSEPEPQRRQRSNALGSWKDVRLLQGLSGRSHKSAKRPRKRSRSP